MSASETLVSDEAEVSVLGSMMLSRTAAEECASILRADDFLSVQHGTIFSAITALLNQGIVPDVVTVGDRLIESGDMQFMGGAGRLHEMTSAVISAANASYYAEIVREAARARRIRAAASNILAALDENADRGAVDLAQMARNQLDAVLDDTITESRPIGWRFDDWLSELVEPPRYRPTPWDDLNAKIDGWRPGALYVIAARPGGGKSIAGVQAAAGLARYGSVALSSLEMSEDEIRSRLVAARAGVPLHALVRHDLTPHHMELIAQRRDDIRKLRLHIDDRAGVTINQIRAHVRAVARNGDLAGVVVDYLQLIQAESSKKERYLVVADITRDLKAIAREYDVPVIALSQLNRGAEGSRATLGHLRESGSIEQDADVVLMLAREQDPDDETRFTDRIEVNVAKNRHGETGPIHLFWEGHFARLTDLSIYE